MSKSFHARVRSALPSVLLVASLAGPAAAQGVWTPAVTGFESLRDNYAGLSFPDAKHGWAVGTDHIGDSAVLVWTADSGATWNRTTFTSLRSLGVVKFISASIGWISGSPRSPDTVNTYKTIDGGANWLPEDPKLKPQYAYFLDATHGWMGGYRTVDGGGNWTAVGLAYVQNVYFKDADTGWGYVGAAISKSVDGGVTWTPQTSGTTNNISGINFADGLHGWASVNGNNTNQKGFVLATSDGGTTWAKQTSTNTGNMYCVGFTGQDTGWAMGRFGQILYTVDGGTTWTFQTRTTDKGLRVFTLTGPMLGWAAGDEGTIMTYGAGVVAIRGSVPGPAGAGRAGLRVEYRVLGNARLQARTLDARGEAVAVRYFKADGAAAGLPPTDRR